MCGIAAIMAIDAPPPTGALEEMVRRVEHRGPDGAGHVWLASAADVLREVEASASASVALGHRRLSIIDLSAAGRQPMRRGTTWVTYNGELYNHVELRAELEQLGERFVSHSDTEVLLAAWNLWGTAAFGRFKGMWGLVLVDAARRRVVACRDRLGIKPLYVLERGGRRWFASEIKQLTVAGTLAPDGEALETYLSTGYEDASRTFFEGVVPLRPGTWTAWSLDTGQQVESGSFWSPETISASVDDPDEAGRALATALRRSVREHLRSDVPVGCALSGGLDSSSLLALVREAAPGGDLNSFTVTFPHEPIDERGFVDDVLARVRAKPHFVTPTPQGLEHDLDRFVWIHDEPVGHVSQYSAYCLARLTREANVPVTLNGQGGDEVLAGYWQSYFAFLQGAARRGDAFNLLKHFGGAALAGNRELLRQVPVMLRRYLARRGSGASTGGELVRRLLAMNDQERRVFEIREMYLPRLLKWDDRNFMAFAVEGRYPFLDHELIEVALSFTPRALYRRGWVKEPLRRGLHGLLPSSILRRRTKLGFEAPQERWLQGPLKSALSTFLDGPSPLWRHARRERVLAVAQAASPSEEDAQTLFRHWMADRWLRVFFESGPSLREAAA